MSFVDKIKNVIFNNFNVDKTNIVNREPLKKQQSGKKVFKYFKLQYDEYMIGCRLDFKELNLALTNNSCVNCGCVLEKEIKGTKTCPECKKKIYVRTDFINKIKIELGEETIDEFERYNKKMNEISYMEKLITNNEYMCPQYLSELSKYNKTGFICREVVWGFSNFVNKEMEI